MILYTPMQLELVLEGLEEMAVQNLRSVKVNGVPALVQDEGTGRGKIIKLLSTDPSHYLNLDLAPGVIINLDSDKENARV